MIGTPMISAAAMDLGLQASLQTSTDEEAARKKKQEQDQKMKSLISAPFTGAFMSLTGNQF